MPPGRSRPISPSPKTRSFSVVISEFATVSASEIRATKNAGEDACFRNFRTSEHCVSAGAVTRPERYGAIQTTLRAGAKPTGIRVVSFMVLISTTETLFVCSLAT